MIELLIDALATVRVGRLIADDIITEPIREWLDDRDDNDAVRFILEGLDCPWCVSVWAATVVAGLHVVTPRLGRLVARTGALAEIGGRVRVWESSHRG